MVRAILDGRKTQTRRVCKNLEWIDTRGAVYMGKPVENYWRFKERTGSFAFEAERHMPYLLTFCPYGMPGHRLWVRETWASFGDSAGIVPPVPHSCQIRYAADGATEWKPVPPGARGVFQASLKNRPSIHMPRWASRITLEITAVRVERLQDISETDAIAEGIEVNDLGRLAEETLRTYKSQRVPAAVLQYADLWGGINGPGSWDLNPFVWVVEFKVLA